ncbi:MAG TPA: ABC transporter ATP-binding protein [Candidatus Saccharimonadales bacterium]|nr:ABC transporter ATP-binding protein [Candidatus Saccharimonadales bacterium]
MPDDDIAIKVDHVSKTFRLPHEKQTSIKGALINWHRSKRGYEKQLVLDDVSFEVKKGEFFGIVGRNGSGKSTLLKLLAGIYTPSSGGVRIVGKLTPFIELGVGFNPELTGRENVYLNGALLGFNRKEMDAMYDDIVKFAEIERFMDQRLKNYSSGMQVRLAFSIAIRANTDILVLDEVLAVGDAAFQQKCNDYFEMLKMDGQKTVILVTHSMDAVEKYCSRAALINDGKMKLIGAPHEVANQYLLENFDPERVETADKQKGLSSIVKSLGVKLKSPVSVTNQDTLLFDVSYELNETLPVYLGIAITHRGVSMLEHNSRSISLGHEKGKKYTVRYSLPLSGFSKTELGIDIAIFNESKGQLIGYKTNAASFYVTTQERFKGGVMMSDGVWTQK